MAKLTRHTVLADVIIRHAGANNLSETEFLAGIGQALTWVLMKMPVPQRYAAVKEWAMFLASTIVAETEAAEKRGRLH